LSCRRSALAHRTLYSARPPGSHVGGDRGSTPDRSALWPDPWLAGPHYCRNHQVDGLGASSRCACDLRGDCSARRILTPAVHHEKNGQGADLGIPACTNRAWSGLAVLGSTGGAALAGNRVCVPGPWKRLSHTFALKIGAVAGGCWLCGDYLNNAREAVKRKAREKTCIRNCFCIAS